PGSKHFTKRWQREKFAAVAVRVAKEFSAKIMLFGGPEERGDCLFVAEAVARTISPDSVDNFAGEMSLLETAAALEFCDI
uniref:glycosyltransferase family 9 protein n=1 Tax=Klebsiella pneumoniae TaxID=573 RepID=UPI0034D6835B